FGALLARRPFPTRRSADLAASMRHSRSQAVAVSANAPPAANAAARPHAILVHSPRLRRNIEAPRTSTSARIDEPSGPGARPLVRSEEHTSELHSRENLVCR